MDIHPSLKRHAFLIGTWTGGGRGDYPTITDFFYTETLIFSVVPGKPFLRYEQKTRGAEGPMHTEVGYLRPAGNHGLELVLAQPTGQTELLTGEVSAEGLSFIFRESEVVNAKSAKQVRATERTYTFNAEHTEMRTTFSMAAVNQSMQPHLVSHLWKQRDLSGLGEIRDHLLDILPRWFRTAAEVAKVELGEATIFSEKHLFFPDCRVSMGGDIYLGSEKLETVQVPLILDLADLVEDLLTHRPGSFVQPGSTGSYPDTWEQASIPQVEDYLWDAVEDCIFNFSYRVEVEADLHYRELVDFPYSPWYSCWLRSFSEGPELKYRSVGWGGDKNTAG